MWIFNFQWRLSKSQNTPCCYWEIQKVVRLPHPFSWKLVHSLKVLFKYAKSLRFVALNSISYGIIYFHTFILLMKCYGSHGKSRKAVPMQAGSIILSAGVLQPSHFICFQDWKSHDVVDFQRAHLCNVSALSHWSLQHQW